MADVTFEGIVVAVFVAAGFGVAAAVAVVSLAAAGFVCMVVAAGRPRDDQA